jgi:hypothetical protein
MSKVRLNTLIDQRQLILWDTDMGECIEVMQPQRIYEGMNLTGVTGITTAQLATLKGLGALA